MKALTVDEFIEVRSEVATQLGKNSQTKRETRERQAEQLMSLGYIDFGAVLGSIDLPPAPGHEAAEEATE